MAKKLFVTAQARMSFGAWGNAPLMEEAGDDTGVGEGAGSGAGEDQGSNDGGDAGSDKGQSSDDGKSTDDGKSSISDGEAKLLKEVMDKKGTIKDLKGELDKFKGVDLEKYNAMVAAEEQRQQDAANAEKKKLEEEGNFTRLKEQMVEEHDKQTGSLKEQIAALEAENKALKGERVELSIGNAFGSSKYITEETNLSSSKARIIYGGHFDVENGQVIPYDKPAGSADRTMLIDGRGEPLPFDQAMQKLVEADPDRDLLIRSKMKPGSSSDSSKIPGSKSNKGNETGKGVHKITAGISDAIAAATKGKK